VIGSSVKKLTIEHQTIGGIRLQFLGYTLQFAGLPSAPGRSVDGLNAATVAGERAARWPCWHRSLSRIYFSGPIGEETLDNDDTKG